MPKTHSEIMAAARVTTISDAARKFSGLYESVVEIDKSLRLAEVEGRARDASRAAVVAVKKAFDELDMMRHELG